MKKEADMLIKKAMSVAKIVKHNNEFSSGEVGCALISGSGKFIRANPLIFLAGWADAARILQ